MMATPKVRPPHQWLTSLSAARQQVNRLFMPPQTTGFYYRNHDTSLLSSVFECVFSVSCNVDNNIFMVLRPDRCLIRYLLWLSTIQTPQIYCAINHPKPHSKQTGKFIFTGRTSFCRCFSHCIAVSDAQLSAYLTANHLIRWRVAEAAVAQLEFLAAWFQEAGHRVVVVVGKCGAESADGISAQNCDQLAIRCVCVCVCLV